MKIREGFEGQRMIVLPEKICDELRVNPITKNLYVTDIGFYPQAKYHHRERKEGSKQNILIYCLDGAGWFSTDHNKEYIRQNQFFVLPAGCGHAYGASVANPWSIYWLHFTGTNARLFTDEVVRARQLDERSTLRNQERLHLFEEIYHNLSSGYSLDNLEYASICLWHLLGTFKYQSQFALYREPVTLDKIERSIAFMTENIHQLLTLEQIAGHCELSVSHFSLSFKRRTSRTPMDYFMHLKIQEACRWLDFSPLKVREVGWKIGISDSYYFSRVFRKIMGVSPKAYRNKVKG